MRSDFGAMWNGGSWSRWFQEPYAGEPSGGAQARWLVAAQNSIPLPFLVTLVFWLAILFISFGLFAPRNATAVMVLLLCAVSVSAAIFLFLEMDRPFDAGAPESPPSRCGTLWRISALEQGARFEPRPPAVSLYTHVRNETIPSGFEGALLRCVSFARSQA